MSGKRGHGGLAARPPSHPGLPPQSSPNRTGGGGGDAVCCEGWEDLLGTTAGGFVNQSTKSCVVLKESKMYGLVLASPRMQRQQYVSPPCVKQSLAFPFVGPLPNVLHPSHDCCVHGPISSLNQRVPAAIAPAHASMSLVEWNSKGSVGMLTTVGVALPRGSDPLDAEEEEGEMRESRDEESALSRALDNAAADPSAAVDAARAPHRSRAVCSLRLGMLRARQVILGAQRSNWFKERIALDEQRFCGQRRNS